MADLKHMEFLQEDRDRLQRALDAVLGEVSMLREGRRSDHHLITVLRETIHSLRQELASLPAKPSAEEDVTCTD